MITIKKIKKKTILFNSWLFKKWYQNRRISNSKKLILFFVPQEVDNVSGGILSICTIYKEILNLKEIHNANVIASFLPNVKGLNYRYTKFDNEIVIYDFDEILQLFNNLESLEVHVPDYMVPLFNVKNIQLDSFFNWSNSATVFKINILNQNDLLMPDLKYIEGLKDITKNVSMTVAHEKYATLERRNYYNVPLHLFSPWLSPTPYIEKKHSKKENIIVLSPDDIDRVPTNTKISKEQIVSKIKESLPNYEIIVIENMSYDEYKKTIAKSKFTITFGEGLDGYFIESILSGSVSFAVYNELFFTKIFKNLPSVYPSFDVLFDKIINDIKYYDNSKIYDEYNTELKQIVNKIYSHKRLSNNVKEYYLGNIDFK